MTFESWRYDILEEKNELSDRIKKLNDFLDSHEFAWNDPEKSRIIAQLQAMQTYKVILNARIVAWSEFQ